jgi:hypothetical protein
MVPGSFYVDSLGPISWNTEALERLVFPESHKDLILAFVTNYGQSIAHSDDVIDGKGILVLFIDISRK